jgi:hypothetical protein
VRGTLLRALTHYPDDYTIVQINHSTKKIHQNEMILFLLDCLYYCQLIVKSIVYVFFSVYTPMVHVS